MMFSVVNVIVVIVLIDLRAHKNTQIRKKSHPQKIKICEGMVNKYNKGIFICKYIFLPSFL